MTDPQHRIVTWRPRVIAAWVGLGMRITGAAIALAGAMVGSPVYGQTDYEPPYGGSVVSIKSPQEGAPDFVIRGFFYKPSGDPKGAIVIVNGSTWPIDTREGHYARAISSAGYAVLVIDSYSPRGLSIAAFDNTIISTFHQLHDALAARRFLIEAGFPADRTGILGSGRGGSIALLAADRTFMQQQKNERFAAVVAVSPTCTALPRVPRPGSVVFMALAELNDAAPIKPCQDLAEDYAKAGGKISVRIYSGAAAGFDGSSLDSRPSYNPHSENFADCRVIAEPDGRFVYRGKTFAETDSGGLIAEMRKSCVRRGATLATNVTQKANATIDLIEFLDTIFRR